MFKLKIIFYWIRFNIRGSFTHRKKLDEYQKNRLARFFNKTLIHAPFYRLFIADKKDFKDFPIIHKGFFMEHFDSINTKGISKEQALSVALKAEEERDFSSTIHGVTVGLSTGTSGKRGLFLVSENERAQWAAMVMTRVVRPVLFKKQRVAFFLRANSNLYNSVQSMLFEFRYFDIFKPIEILAQELDRFRPDMLAAQPSVLVHLAEFQKAGIINIRPTTIISFAEVLYPEDKVFIQSVFNGVFKEVYQCTEGFLGVTCAHGTMHLNEDIVFVEKRYLDEKRFHPIVTDFTRTTQPVVRYELDDILVEAENPCPCGSCFTAIDRIEGRSNDVLEFKNKQGAIVKIYPDLITRLVARATDDFRGYKIIQRSDTDLLIELNVEEDQWEVTSTTIAQAIRKFLEERFIENVVIGCTLGITYVSGSKHRKIEKAFRYENKN